MNFGKVRKKSNYRFVVVLRHSSDVERKNEGYSRPLLNHRSDFDMWLPIDQKDREDLFLHVNWMNETEQRIRQSSIAFHTWWTWLLPSLAMVILYSHHLIHWNRSYLYP